MVVEVCWFSWINWRRMVRILVSNWYVLQINIFKQITFLSTQPGEMTIDKLSKGQRFAPSLFWIFWNEVYETSCWEEEHLINRDVTMKQHSNFWQNYIYTLNFDFVHR
jgi:hypothetical protein